MNIEEIAREVVDCGYKLHTRLGPGLLESVYEVVVAKTLTERGFLVERQKQVLTYLRLLNLPLGLPMNFGSFTLQEGVKRIVNNHQNFASSRLRVHQNPEGKS